MKYKTIRGKSASECMSIIRATYGDSAVISTSREVPGEGLFGSGFFASNYFEVDIMIPEGDDGRSGSSRVAAAEARERSRNVENLTGRSEQLLEKLRLINGQLDQRSLSSTAATTPAQPRPIVAPVAAAALEEPLQLASAEYSSVITRDEMDALLGKEFSSFVADGDSAESQLSAAEALERAAELTTESDVAARSRKASSRDEERYFRQLDQVRQRLATAMLSDEFIDRFVQGLDDSLSRRERVDQKQVERRVLEQLSSYVTTMPELHVPPGGCLAVMLIGPPGSGKTTSLAKLAARYRLGHSRDISFYSLDHYRLGAFEQLRLYAEILHDSPVVRPTNPDDFRRHLENDSAEIMFIDTSGISVHEYDRREMLKSFVDVCPVRLEKHLVIQANTSPRMLEPVLEFFDEIGFDKILLTRLDEADFIGAHLEVADKWNRPFSYFANGQDVAKDIMEPAALDVARMVYQGEGLYPWRR